RHKTERHLREAKRTIIYQAFSFTPTALCSTNIPNSAWRGGVSGAAAGQNCDTCRGLLSASLYDKHIGYDALHWDNTPCPPSAAGRSYYTPDCSIASGPVNPYTRGCSKITHCARDVS
ncbi:hypothetical protein GOP47_0003068, partial [Adiantum capillus-veneris]